jgi:hypothetical protein
MFGGKMGMHKINSIFRHTRSTLRSAVAGSAHVINGTSKTFSDF